MERFIMRLTQNLRGRGVRVDVYTGTHFGGDVDSDGVVRLPTFLMVMGNPLIPGLVRVVKQDRFDVVHAHDEHAFTSNEVAYAAPRMRGSFVMHCHGSYTGGAMAWRLFVYLYMKTLGSYTLSHADATVALSPAEATILKKFGAQNIRIIPNAVDADELDTSADPSRFRSRYNIGSKKVVLFVGRLIKVKGVGHLPHIAHALSAVRDDVAFAVVGDGPMREELVSRVRGLGLRNFVVTGRLSTDMLSSAYRAADVVLVPSQSEGMPAVVLESILFRKPVVATRLPTLTDYFQHVCSFVDPGDTVGYAFALNRTLKAPPAEHTVDEAQRLVREQFNWRRVTDQVMDLYRQLVDQRHETPGASPQ
jgi:glycosyltransferase involved in cell wall biosynthesis